jgi:hypothetical protein
MYHVNQYPADEQDWWINWLELIGTCPTGMSLVSSEWSAVGQTGMSFMNMGIDQGWYANVRASGGEPDNIYILANTAVIYSIEDGTQTMQERIEFYILPQ